MISEDQEKFNTTIDSVIGAIARSAKKDVNPMEHHDAFWTATAMLISYSGSNWLNFWYGIFKFQSTFL